MLCTPLWLPNLDKLPTLCIHGFKVRGNHATKYHNHPAFHWHGLCLVATRTHWFSKQYLFTIGKNKLHMLTAESQRNEKNNVFIAYSTIKIACLCLRCGWGILLDTSSLRMNKWFSCYYLSSLATVWGNWILPSLFSGWFLTECLARWHKITRKWFSDNPWVWTN